LPLDTLTKRVSERSQLMNDAWLMILVASTGSSLET